MGFNGMKQPIFKEFIVKTPITPFYQQQLREGQEVEPVEIHFGEQRMWSINEKLNPMKESDLKRIHGKRIHILALVPPERVSVMAEHGDCTIHEGKLYFKNGWCNIQPNDVIDWYFE